VGLFVLFALALAAGLLIRFSKGTTFRSTYALILKTVNVGGLKTKASVLMSGVQVGSVAQIDLGTEGTNVTVTVRIYSQYNIRDDATFIIEQSGFLGDPFVAVYPGENKGKKLEPGAEAQVEAPFNLQQTARAAAGFITRIDVVASNINDAVNDLRQRVLNKETLSNMSVSIANLHKVSENALVAVDKINGLITSNTTPVGEGVSNLVAFTDQLKSLAQSARDILVTNQPQISTTVSNLELSSIMLTNFVADLRNQKGLVGTLIQDETLAKNVSGLASNLNEFTAFLKSHSFWHVMFNKPPPPETNAPASSPKYPEAEPKKEK
jgi:phospholipid/cholesterol/gamma-HCH transport system substrate-binding protein